MSHKKINESHDASGKGPTEGMTQANQPLNEGNPNHQDVKRRIGNFTGTGEPARQGDRNHTSGKARKGNGGSPKKK